MLPRWKPLVEYAASEFPLLYLKGGTTCVTVQQVAQAISGAVENCAHGAHYPIGGENLPWSDLLARFARYAGREKKVVTLPDWLVTAGAAILKAFHKVQGVESGLNPVQFIKLQTAETYIDPELSRSMLGYELGGLDEALKETVRVCLNKQDPARGSSCLITKFPTCNYQPGTARG